MPRTDLDMIVIRLEDGEERRVRVGTPVREIIQDDGQVLAASVDHLTVGLDHLLVRSAAVKALRYEDKQGNEVYRRSLSFLACAAARQIFPDSKMVIGHSLAGGYYFDLSGPDSFSPENIARIEQEMHAMIAEDLPLKMVVYSLSEAIELFQKISRNDKVQLLRRSHDFDIPIYHLKDFVEMPIGPLAPTTGRLDRFSLKFYPPGMVLRFPHKRDIALMPQASDQTRLFAVYHESKKWSQILSIENVGSLNEMVAQRAFHECVQVAEGLHEKKIAMIADQITDRVDVTRLIFIAGPSSSGKTSFAKRLSVQLRVNGLMPIAIGLDDYFVDREKTPKDKTGEYDFESIHALNIELLNDNLLAILDGQEVTIPRFDFKQGKSLEGHRKIRLAEDQVLVVEGIHGLNDALTPRIPAERKFKIYVSALTQLTIDNMNRIPTTDTRLIRRIIRDRRYRGYSAGETIRRWPSVIRGEAANIFPHQEGADVIFNTALLYELAVLKRPAWQALEEVQPTEPEFAEARRIMEFLHLFLDADDEAVPPTSILREFIGGSSFRY